MRLIDADAIELRYSFGMVSNEGIVCIPMKDVRKSIDEMPTIDAVPVVRCENCVHCIDAYNDGYMYCMRPLYGEDYQETGYKYPLEERVSFIGFCHYGERKENA